MGNTVFGTEDDDIHFVINGDSYFGLGGSDTIHGSDIGRIKWEEIDIVNAFTGDVLHIPADTFDRYQLFADGGNGLDTYKISGDDLIQFFGFGFSIQNIERIESVDSPGPIILNMTSLLENFGDMTVVTSSGDDVIWSSNGNDFLDSKNGNDTVRGAGGNDNIEGGSGDDHLYGDEGNDQIFGYDPDKLQPDTGDVLFEPGQAMGEGEINNLYGGDGDDTLNNGAAAGLVFGGHGNDTLIGFSRTQDGSHPEGDAYTTPPQNSPASMYGEAGNDSLTDGAYMDGGEGDDTIKNNGLQSSTAYGGDGNDSIDVIGIAYGGKGDDTLTTHEFVYLNFPNDGYPEPVVISGGSFFGEEGNDTILTQNSIGGLLDGGIGNDTLTGKGAVYYGGDGNDVIANFSYTVDNGQGGDARQTYVDVLVYAGAGNDTVNASGQIYGEDGNDVIFGDGNIYGGNGDDNITAKGQIINGPGDDDEPQYITAEGGAGNDIITGAGLQDTLLGQDGNDGISGKENNDHIEGGAGHDILFGDGGADRIFGGKGDDFLSGGVGYGESPVPDIYVEPSDYIDGEEGFDTVTYASSQDAVVVNLKTNANSGAALNDELYNIESVIGSNLDDTIAGGDGNETLSGEGGKDTLKGGIGKDTLKGQAGNDNLFGEDGDDILWGNDGEDILNGNHGTDWIKGGAGKDLFILDSRDGVDTIADFRTNEKIDLTTLLGGSVGFLASQAFTNGYIRLEQSGADTLLHIDIDGQSGSDPEQLLAILLDAQASRFGLANFILPVVNTPPIAKDDFFTGQEDAALSGNVLIDNGLGADTDPDGHPLSVLAQNITTLAGGSVALLGNGGFIYTPKPNFFGNDSFEYTVIDGKGGSDVGKVSMSLQDVPEPGNPLFLSGDSANNTLLGGDSNDTLKGQAGDDVLIGNAGADTLWGNNGNDILYGGSGSDWMKGGDGADLFVLDGLINDNFDTIADLRISGGDKIQIKDILSYDPVNDAISDFVRITQNGSGSVLSVDVDGSGSSASFALAAKIEGITGLDVNQLYNEGDLVIRHIVV